MSTPVLLALGGAALLVFWVLGAYNRLVELRNAAADAWAQAAEALRRRADALARLLAALREPLAAEAAALEQLESAHESAARAASRMNARPLLVENAAAWVDAETRLGAAAVRVFALLEAAGEPTLGEPVATACTQWRESSQRLSHSRQLFNDAAAMHDAALGVFPTSLLVGLFGFRRAGRV